MEKAAGGENKVWRESGKVNDVRAPRKDNLSVLSPQHHLWVFITLCWAQLKESAQMSFAKDPAGLKIEG